jgi:hypothetical protein
MTSLTSPAMRDDLDRMAHIAAIRIQRRARRARRTACSLEDLMRGGDASSSNETEAA